MSPAEQLIFFERAVAACSDEASLARLAVDEAAAKLGAPLAAFVRAEEIVAVAGSPAGDVEDDVLLRVARAHEQVVELPGRGTCRIERALIDGASGGRLIVARPGEAFSRDESALLQGMARVLGRPLTMMRLVEHGRAVREDTQRESAGGSLTRYRNAFAQSASGMAIEATDGRLLHVNGAICALLGSDPETLIGRRSATRLHRDDRAGAEAARAAVVAGELATAVAERRLTGAGGGVHWVVEHLAGVRDDDGVVAEVVVQYHDITERKRADEALRISQAALSESQGRYQALVEHLPVTTFITLPLAPGTTELPLYYMSPQIEALAGFPAERWLEPGFWGTRVHPDDAARADTELLSAAIGTRRSSEYRLLAASGETVWVRTELEAIADPDGHPFVQGFLVDITDRVRAERRRDELEQELRLAQKLEAVGQLGAGIAHEINTPVQFVGDSVRFLEGVFEDLTALVDDYQAVVAAAAAGPVDPALLERVRDGEDHADLDYVAERAPKAIARALDGLARVGAIVAAMKDFAEAPGADTIALDLNEAVRSTLVVGRHEYKYVADVTTELAELPAIAGNQSQLQQVILDLVVNAAHAIADRGDEHGRIDVRTFAEGDAVVLEVADTGCGIPPEVAGRVFDPFFTTKDVGRGTGQGLAVAHRVVTAEHGGTIGFRTAVGEGTTFVVRLPVERVAASGS